MAEHIPFRDGSFSDVTVLAALDHFKDLAAFFREARRVLRPAGRLHVLQSIHEQRSLVRRLAHRAKDALEDRSVKSTANGDAPHHMTEFDLSTLHRAIDESFRSAAEQPYSQHWYSPRKLFLTLVPRD